MKGKVIISLFILFAYVAGKSQSAGAMDANELTVDVTGIQNTATANNPLNEIYEQNQQPATVDCRTASPMPVSDFSGALKIIKNLAVDEMKLRTAKEVALRNCMSTGQIAEFCKTFSFEDSKLNFAKFAYDHCTEPQNYFKLNDVFGFSSKVDELNKYVQSKE